jgi:hypothetical protein
MPVTNIRLIWITLLNNNAYLFINIIAGKNLCQHFLQTVKGLGDAGMLGFRD